MFIGVDEWCFAAGVATPKQEDGILGMVADEFNYAVGEPWPATIRVGIGLVGADGQGSI